MVNFPYPSAFSRLSLYIIFTTFSLTTLSVPCYSESYETYESVRDRIIKLKIVELEQELLGYAAQGDIVKLVDTMFEIKYQTEWYTNTYIDIDKEFMKILGDLIDQGLILYKKDFFPLRKILNEKDKNNPRKHLSFSESLHKIKDENEFFELTFENQNEKLNKKEEKKRQQEENLKKLPVKIAYGITSVLAAAFILVVYERTKIPIFYDISKELAYFGSGLIIFECLEIMDQRQKKEEAEAENDYFHVHTYDYYECNDPDCTQCHPNKS